MANNNKVLEKHPLARKRRLMLVILPILLVVISIGSLMMGQVSFSVGEVLQGLFTQEDTMALSPTIGAEAMMCFRGAFAEDVRSVV